MKIKRIFPSIAHKVKKIITPETECLCGHLKQQTLEHLPVKPDLYSMDIMQPVVWPECKPVVVSKKAQEALDAINSMRNRTLMDEVIEKGEFLPEPFVVRYKMKNGDSVELSREREINPNLDITFFDKNGQEREKVNVATHSVICNEFVELCVSKGQLNKYSTQRNNVMRPTDPLNRDPKHEMTFEETVRTRPVILTRINSLLEKLGDEISGR